MSHIVRLIAAAACLAPAGCALNHHHKVKSASYNKMIMSDDETDDPNFRPDEEEAGTIIREQR